MQFEQAFQGNQFATANTTIDGDFIRVNDKFLELTGYTREQLARMSFRDITPEKWFAVENGWLVREVFKHGKASYQKEYIKADGSIIPVSLHVELMRTEQGEVSGMWAWVEPDA